MVPSALCPRLSYKPIKNTRNITFPKGHKKCGTDLQLTRRRNIMQSLTTFFAALLTTVCLLLPHTGQAQDKGIRFAGVTWTGVTVKTQLAVKILETLGYKADNTILPLPLIYKSLEMGDMDVFLGNWMPSMKTVAGPFFERGTVTQLTANMPGAQYTLAVPTYVAQGGLKDFSDIAKFADKLDHKIYGIEPGNDGNKIIKSMIDNNDFGLGEFKLVETSEPIMLAEVKALTTKKKWVVFLGWAPHHMNDMIDMTYLTGSTDATFGANNGMATVYTNTRKGFTTEHTNITAFLNNYTFTIDMMNQIMTLMQENKELKHLEAALLWLKSHPETIAGWLENVTTKDGKPALPVVAEYIKNVKL